MNKTLIQIFLVSMMVLGSTISYAEVKWTGLQEGEVFYTRGCSKEETRAWIYRMKVEKVDTKGVAWGTSEMATITDPEFDSLYFPSKLEGINISKTCVSGGCYTEESEATADVKKWLTAGCS